MTQEELDKIIEVHQHWINRDCKDWKQMRADLSGQNLTKLNLSQKKLSGAILNNAILCYADLSGADLWGAQMKGVDLFHANLELSDCYESDFSKAHFHNTILTGAHLDQANFNKAVFVNTKLDANLYWSNFAGAEFRGISVDSYTNLEGVNLFNVSFVHISPHSYYPTGRIISEDIYGYKKCEDKEGHSIIVKLKIPRGAIVFSINGRKCRTNQAEVISIEGADRAYSQFNHISYYVGDKFFIYNFDCQYNVECGEGIHFFMTKKEAEQYLY